MLSSIFGSTPGAQSGQTQSLVGGNTAFALDLYGQLKTSKGNLFFSPYSISTALAMTCAGGRGDTKKQMAGVLHFDKIEGQLHSSLSHLQRQLGEASKQTGIESIPAVRLRRKEDAAPPRQLPGPSEPFPNLDLIPTTTSCPLLSRSCWSRAVFACSC